MLYVWIEVVVNLHISRYLYFFLLRWIGLAVVTEFLALEIDTCTRHSFNTTVKKYCQHKKKSLEIEWNFINLDGSDWETTFWQWTQPNSYVDPSPLVCYFTVVFGDMYTYAKYLSAHLTRQFNASPSGMQLFHVFPNTAQRRCYYCFTVNGKVMLTELYELIHINFPKWP